MSRRRKAMLALAIYPSLAWLAAAGLLVASGYFERGDHRVVAAACLALTAAAGAALLAAYVYGLAWVIRNLRGADRAIWLATFVLAGSLAPLAWWALMIRPLPGPPGAPERPR